MARIIGGLGSPHAPSIGTATDKGQEQSPEWKPLFDGYAPIRQWLDVQKPDLILMVYNDHANTFFFDKYPTFAISVAAEHEIADAVERVVNLYLKTRQPGERFLDTYRRVGMAPFKDAAYEKEAA